MMDVLRSSDHEVAEIIDCERDRQLHTIELIASENFTSVAVMRAVGSVLTNKYAEGLPGKRYYGGCGCVDQVEQLAIDRAKQLFGTEHVNVQPHSGAQANMAAMFSVLDPGDRILGMSLDQGGHLTHGSRVNFSGRFFEAHFYQLNPETEQIDFDRVRSAAHDVMPKMIIAGASAYSRLIDFAKFREIADEVGAVFLADIAHIAGMVAVGLHPTSIGNAHITTTTTHKTLRGPRGGMIMSDEDHGTGIDKTVFPGMQGGPLMHVIAGKAVALGEALTPEYHSYIERVLANAKTLCETLQSEGLRIVSGGTDNHLMLLDLTSVDMSGRKAQRLLEQVGITTNKNAIPGDKRPPTQTTGIRLGSPAMTTRGFGTAEMRATGHLIARVLRAGDDEKTIESVQHEVAELVSDLPLPGVAMQSAGTGDD